MSTKKNWISPATTLEVFQPNAYIAACDTQTVRGSFNCAYTGTELTAVGTKYAANNPSANVYATIPNKDDAFYFNASGDNNNGAGGWLYEEFSFTKNDKTYYAFSGQLNDTAHGSLTHPAGYGGEFFTGTTPETITVGNTSYSVYKCPDCGFISGTSNDDHHHVEFGYTVIANPS